MEHLVALNDPSNFKVIRKLDRGLLCALKILRFIVWIRFALHQCKSLIASAFINRKYKNDMISHSISISQFFCWTSRSWPNCLFYRNLNTFMIKTLNNKKSGSSFDHWLRIFNDLFNFFPSPHHILVIAPFWHYIWECPSEWKINWLCILKFIKKHWVEQLI